MLRLCWAGLERGLLIRQAEAQRCFWEDHGHLLVLLQAVRLAEYLLVSASTLPPRSRDMGPAELNKGSSVRKVRLKVFPNLGCCSLLQALLQQGEKQAAFRLLQPGHHSSDMPKDPASAALHGPVGFQAQPEVCRQDLMFSGSAAPSGLKPVVSCQLRFRRCWTCSTSTWKVTAVPASAAGIAHGCSLETISLEPAVTAEGCGVQLVLLLPTSGRHLT